MLMFLGSTEVWTCHSQNMIMHIIYFNPCSRLCDFIIPLRSYTTYTWTKSLVFIITIPLCYLYINQIIFQQSKLITIYMYSILIQYLFNNKNTHIHKAFRLDFIHVVNKLHYQFIVNKIHR